MDQNVGFRIDGQPSEDHSPGAKLILKLELARLRLLVEAFYGTASLADAVALRTALEWRGHPDDGSNCATLVEAFAAMLGIGISCNDPVPVQNIFENFPP